MRWLVIFWLVVGVSLPANARQVSPEALLALGNQALAAQEPQQALQVAHALLQRDGTDFSALLLGSYAARDLGQIPEAVSLAKQAWAQAKDRQQRHSAALALAQAQSSGGHRLAAQYWLRRALSLAPTPQARAITARDYRYVRSRNPLFFDAKISITPSDNVNGGTSTEEIALGPITLPIPNALQALSGVETMLKLEAARTVVENEQRRDRVGVQVTSRWVALSKSAKQAAPTASGSEYAYQAYDFYYETRHHSRIGELFARATLGHNRFGGTPLSHYQRLSLGWSRPFSPSQRLTGEISYENQSRQDDPRASAGLQSLTLDWEQALPTGRLTLSGSALRARAQSASVDRFETGLASSFTLAKPLYGAELTLFASAREKRYSFSGFTGGARVDHISTLGAEIFLREKDLLGFAPVVSLTQSRTGSDAVFYNSEQVSLGLGFRSAF